MIVSGGLGRDIDVLGAMVSDGLTRKVLSVTSIVTPPPSPRDTAFQTTYVPGVGLLWEHEWARAKRLEYFEEEAIEWMLISITINDVLH